MVSRAINPAVPTESARNSPFENDPPPVTACDSVNEFGVLRLRHYAPLTKDSGHPPVLLVYSLFKRPYILDLDEERSVVRSFLERGMNLYLVDWAAPRSADATSGLGTYIGDLARAVDHIREKERTPKVSIVGICFGGLLSLIYAALHADRVQHLVPVAVGIEQRPIIPPVVVEQAIFMHGNVPAWWVRGTLNSRVPATPLVPQYLARELEEPRLAAIHNGRYSPICEKLIQWVDSDVPFAGQLARDIMRKIYWDGQLANGELEVDGTKVNLSQIRCPVLNISGSRDLLVPPKYSLRLVKCVNSSYARNFIFPSGHMGLMASQTAHEELWPRVCTWLKIID